MIDALNQFLSENSNHKKTSLQKKNSSKKNIIKNLEKKIILSKEDSSVDEKEQLQDLDELKEEELDDDSDDEKLEEKKSKTDPQDVKLNYGHQLEDELLLSGAYTHSSLDYATLFSYLGTSQVKENEDFYQKIQNMVWSDTDKEFLDTEEAEVKMNEVCYAQILGTSTDIDYISRRKLANWIAFNPALFKLFEAQSITNNVNYSDF